MASFDRIKHPPQRLADDVYDQLVSAIIGGLIVPGEHLVQEALADEMSVSRTPVREALLRLAEEGFIKHAQTRGFEVVATTEDMIRSIYESRQAVEGFAARLTAENATDEQIAALGPVLRQEIDISAPSSYEENLAAHRAIVAACGNDTMLVMFDTVWVKARSIRMVYNAWAQSQPAGAIAHSHGELFETIASHDGAAAERAMIEHLEYGHTELLATLEKMRGGASVTGDAGT